MKAGGVTARHNCRSVTCASERFAPRRSVSLRTLRISVEGFEPSTSCARGTRATKLRYTLLIALGGSRTRSFSLKGEIALPLADESFFVAALTDGLEPPTFRLTIGRSTIELLTGIRFSKNHLSRVDSNHDQRIQNPSLCRLSATAHLTQGEGIEPSPSGSEPDVLPTELSLTIPIQGRELESNQQPAVYETAAPPIELSRHL